MADYKAEWYLKRNAELTKALLKIKRVVMATNWDTPQTTNGFLKIKKIVDSMNLESGYRTVDDKDGSK